MNSPEVARKMERDANEHLANPTPMPSILKPSPPPAPMPEPTPPAKVVSMSPKWTVRQKTLLQAAWKPCLCAEAEGCAGGCNPPSFVNHIIHRNTPNVRQPPPPPPPPSLPNDCYWKVFADDDSGPGFEDPCPDFGDRQKDSDEGEAPREASGPSDRNFGMFCPVKKPRQNRNRKERKKQQARSSQEPAPEDDEEVEAGAMSDDS